MRVNLEALAGMVVLSVGLGSCGGGYGSTPVTTTTTTPPAPLAGSIRFQDATLPTGSTVPVAPMGTGGQQAQSLQFRAAITLTNATSGALVRAWVRTASTRCMGGGQARVDFPAGVELVVSPLSMSNPGSGQPVCALPYSTSLVEFEVVSSAGLQLLTVSFPAVYNFVEER